MEKTLIRVSQIKAYQTCPRMYYFNYVKRLTPKVENNKLLFGTGIHKGLEVFYRTGSADEAVRAFNTWLKEQEVRLQGLNADPEHTEEAKRIGVALLQEYCIYAKQHDDFVPVAVEQTFEVPIWTPKGKASMMIHRGTVDLIVEDKYGKLWLGEHKTARDTPSALELQLNFQASVYLLAATQLYDRPISGVVYNILRKVDPKRAKTPVINRMLVPRTAIELANTSNQLYAWARRMLTDKDYLPSSGRHCSWMCAYSSLCQCMQDGTDYNDVAEFMYDVRKEVRDDDERNESDAG